MALTPKEPPWNGLGGEEKTVRIAKALLRTEVDCSNGLTGKLGMLEGLGVLQIQSRRGTEGEGYGPVKTQICGEDGQLILPMHHNRRTRRNQIA